ncbi:four helix bundle protein [Fulvivirga sp. RKSG066]|uniref:four helix bundle protein n=1 Tax=Fulvivirga aurantia TaxID=2529383 RepID=UPI0012BB943A|nr:four helix bundle protein [Fulvivirga aurantia]MTI22085.1 four helix bundle protein [Fulvivirga aurantia]
MHSFEELFAWKKARAFRSEISGVVKKFPSDEKYRLTDQILRSSRSVTANIAEGFGRFHYQENIQFCRQARGSLFEVLDHLICAKDEKLISVPELKSLREQFDECLKVLNGYIAYLKKAKLN